MPTNDERIQRAKKNAHENDRHSGCSQGVLLSLQEEFSIGNNEVFKAATVLSGGVARHGETCGALIGALMALGLVVGREKMEDTEAYRESMKPSADLIERFKEELKKQFGFEGELDGTLCKQIHEKIYGRPFDMMDPEDYRAFLDAGGHGDNGCLKVCGVAAQVGAEKILESMAERETDG
ncbi:MAG: C_GCAxxG_C_C family protein [Rhodospirillales bacterium]|nr:C_GCAxxG_C_C family protein [Rhodospirillales bacterium]